MKFHQKKVNMRRPENFKRPFSLPQLLQQRQQTDEPRRLLQNRLHAPRALIDRLELETELSGHGGCVNCLEWNESGTLLASGSDDYHIKFWNPFRHRVAQDLLTQHTGNIFSVKFLPQTGDSVVATSAGDGLIFSTDRNHPEKPLIKCR